MTRRISLVAVCWSSDSTRSRLRISNSLNSRTFYRLVGEGLEKLNLWFGEVSDWFTPDHERANRVLFTHQWDSDHCSIPHDEFEMLQFVFDVLHDVGNLHDPPLDDCASGRRAARRTPGKGTSDRR
jgi:hypothetical protein